VVAKDGEPPDRDFAAQKEHQSTVPAGSKGSRSDVAR
jgi:hypothetical protein